MWPPLLAHPRPQVSSGLFGTGLPLRRAPQGTALMLNTQGLVRRHQASVTFPLGAWALLPGALLCVGSPHREYRAGRERLPPATTRSWAGLSSQKQHAFSPQQCCVLDMTTINNGASIMTAVQSLSRVLLWATPWTAACQAPLSFTISWIC